MHTLNKELAAERYAAEWIDAADWYRTHAIEAYHNPDFVLQHLDHPVVSQKLNAEFNTSTVERTRMFEALSYGDPSFLLTTPGPSLSGVLLEVLGNQWQQDMFVEHVQQQTARTFFAVTEPEKGSDAGNLLTTLSDGTALNGRKLLVGNGALGSIGTVLFKSGQKMLGLGAVMLPPDALKQSNVHRQVLDMYALRGAQLSYLEFKNLTIEDEFILGAHLNPIERGMMGLLKTFHKFRPAVSSMAIGHAQALLDYFKINPDQSNDSLQLRLKARQSEVDAAREINRRSAHQADKDPLKGGLVSHAKQLATVSLEYIVNDIFELIDSSVLLESVWLQKSLTDAFGYEYMEGTSHIHFKNIYNAYKRKEILH
ncbi:acyl-CoA dehydrogenase family protein [Marinicella sp. W31]|uniref:acyl-CoA dehydrogenase family protein n=1 Tax=Marinicella sp. W31 TaxID=3023713 RepID=UPI0037576235